jgi:hypothetical protein
MVDVFLGYSFKLLLIKNISLPAKLKDWVTAPDCDHLRGDRRIRSVLPTFEIITTRNVGCWD